MPLVEITIGTIGTSVLKLLKQWENAVSAHAQTEQHWPTTVAADTPACTQPTILPERRSGRISLQYALTLEEVGSLLDAGLVLVSEAYAILAATARTRAYLQAGAGLAERDGVLQFRRCSTERNFRAFLKQRAALDDGMAPEHSPTPEFFGIPDAEGHVHYAMWQVSWLSETTKGSVLLAITDLTAEEGGVERASVTAVFGLSVREAQLAELFSKGLRLEQIAQRMGLTLNTARVHLRQVFLKTNCSGQLELARVLALLHGSGGGCRSLSRVARLRSQM